MLAGSRSGKSRPTPSPALSVSIPSNAPAPSRAVAASVTFEPGARTASHTHPFGQTLLVTAGCDRAQMLGRPARRNPPGRCDLDFARRKALARRAPTTAMTHIDIQEHLDGKTDDWMEKVSDDLRRPYEPRRKEARRVCRHRVLMSGASTLGSGRCSASATTPPSLLVPSSPPLVSPLIGLTHDELFT
jgi:quercetin dioxygenase-like cupin family protein